MKNLSNMTSVNKKPEQHDKQTGDSKYVWKKFNRGDALPKTSVYAGETSTDGAVYVGRVENTPGKVNLDGGKIWNYWVNGFDSRQSGEMLLTQGDCDWLRIKRGDGFPENAVFAGRD